MEQKIDELKKLIDEHFINQDRTNKVVEMIIEWMQDFDRRLRALEMLQAKKDDDDKKGDFVLA